MVPPVARKTCVMWLNDCPSVGQSRLAGNTVSVCLARLQIRGLAAVMEAGADIINISYGEVRLLALRYGVFASLLGSPCCQRASPGCCQGSGR
jgi:hypothetical protein